MVKDSGCLSGPRVIIKNEGRKGLNERSEPTETNEKMISRQ